jgi:diguanylate cyclase (GGDEF)-like protein/PAS domain S-box-containing protein
MSMRQLLFVCFTLIAVVPVVALSVWVQHSALDREMDAVEEKHLLLAHNLTDALARYSRDVEATFGLTAYRVMAGTFDSSLTGLLRELSFDHFCIVDEEGKLKNAIIVDERASRLTGDVWNRLAPFWREAAGNRERTLFTPVISDSQGKPRIFIIRSIAEDSFAIGALRTDYPASLQKRIAFGKKGHAAIVDRTGQVIAHPNQEWMQSHKDLSQVRPVAAMMRGETGVTTFFSPALKADMIAGYSTEPRTGWGVMIPQPISELQKAAEADWKAALGVGLIGMTVAALLSWILSGLIARPIRRISEAAGRSAIAGDLLPVSVDATSLPREIDELTAAYNGMVEMIANRDRRAAEADEKLDEAQMLAGIGNWRWNLSSREMWWSNAVYNMLGIARGDVVPGAETLGRFVHPEDRKRVADAINSAVDKGGRFSLDHRIVASDGSVLHVEQAGEVAYDDETGDVMMIGTIYDITERKRNEDTLYRQANFDPVTGLANRNHFMQHLDSALGGTLEGKDSFALIYIDLDGFKTVNELRGTDAGDALLSEVGRRLLETCPYDDVARLGSDEFAILTADKARADQAAALAQQVLDRLSRPYRLGDKDSFVGASLGIALFPTDSRRPADLLHDAETAMHRAKRAGRNAWRFFTDKMREDFRLRTGLENDLRRSWERKEFSVVYQPIVDLKTGHITAAEALIQWRHPDRGLVSTQSIIPIIEDIGLIGLIGRWVLETAATDARKWREAGCGNLAISVNLSGRQLERGLTVDAITDAMETAGLPPSALILEMTESILVDDMEAAIDWLSELRDRGVRVAIDDFGTGYSSLAYLKRMPANAIKIDREFVAHILNDERDLALVRSILALAQGLDLKVVAEGIEEQAQCDVLRELGCEYGQGYLFSRPMTAGDFTDYARKQARPSVIKIGDRPGSVETD